MQAGTGIEQPFQSIQEDNHVNRHEDFGATLDYKR
jgi:hypothetical protein